MARDYTAAGRALGRSRAAGLEGLELAFDELAKLKNAMDGSTLATIVQEQTAHMYADAQARVTFGRGVYRAHIRTKTFTNADGYAGTVFVTQGPWARNPRQRWPKQLPVWLEYGTRRMAARPHLIPAFNAARERFSRAVERLLQTSA